MKSEEASVMFTNTWKEVESELRALSGQLEGDAQAKLNEIIDKLSAVAKEASTAKTGADTGRVHSPAASIEKHGQRIG